LTNKASLIYVCTSFPEDAAKKICAKLLEELDIKIEAAASIQEIFPKLSDPAYKVDYVSICTDDLYGLKSADAFDLLKTLSTLINCTVCRERAGTKPVKRQTKIIIVVGEDTDPKLIKELILMPEVHHFILKVGGKIGYNEVKESIENLLNGRERVPKAVVDLIRPKKPEVKKASGTIQLTSRQQQIFDILTTRGSSNKHIAKMLSISESTVKLHVGCILKKYGVKNRTQLAVFSKLNY
jgi:DNA-binding NarL/FixJ family response regulator